jgi:hypothetical protein
MKILKSDKSENCKECTKCDPTDKKKRPKLVVWKDAVGKVHTYEE